MLSILTGIIVGVVMALPPGPAALTAIKLGLSNSSRHGFLSGLGTAVMDFIYCFIAIVATSALIDWASNFSDKHPFITISVQMTFVVAIIYIGFLHLKSTRVNTSEGDNQKYSFIERLYERGPFFVGIGIALTNIVNPTFLPSLGYVAINVQKFGFVESGILSNFAFALGFGVGNFLWLMFLVKLFVSFKSRMSESFIARIHKFAGLTLIGFGTFLGYRVLELAKWSEIFRFVFAF